MTPRVLFPCDIQESNHINRRLRIREHGKQMKHACFLRSEKLHVKMDAVSVMLIFLKLSISVAGRKISLPTVAEDVDEDDQDEEDEKMENWLQSISDAPNMKLLNKKARFQLGASKNFEITSLADFPMQMSTHDVQIPNGNVNEERLTSTPYHNVDSYTSEENHNAQAELGNSPILPASHQQQTNEYDVDNKLKHIYDRDNIINEIINNSFRPDDTTGLRYGNKSLFYAK